MAIDSAIKRSAMLKKASGGPWHSRHFDPTGSDLNSALERFTVLGLYGANAGAGGGGGGGPTPGGTGESSAGMGLSFGIMGGRG